MTDRDRRQLLRLLALEERRTEPLYRAAHEALLGTHGLSGLMIGLRWNGSPRSSFPRLPGRDATEAEAQVIMDQGPAANETVRRADAAFWIWTVWRQLRLLDHALQVYVSSEPIHEAKQLLRRAR